jgi:hypothetical protein
MTDEEYQWFIDFVRECRKRCHHKNCRYIRECPAEHPKCNKLLDLRTAILWKIADYIEEDIIYTKNRRHVLYYIGLCRNIFVLHYDKYQEEAVLLEEVYYRVREIKE